MGLGLGGSAIAGYFSFSAARARESVLSLLVELERLIAEARQAQDAAALDEAEARVDAIFSRTLKAAMANTVDAGAMAAFNLAFAKARDAGQGPAGSPGLPSLSQPSMPRAAARPVAKQPCSR